MTEIELLRKAGLKPMQIIVAATKNAAEACNLPRSTGTVQQNKNADLLIISGDPLKDIKLLNNIKMVVHNGVIVRDDLSGSANQ